MVPSLYDCAESALPGTHCPKILAGALVRERLMHPLILFLTALLLLLDVRVVARHGAVFAALLFFFALLAIQAKTTE